jgi:hypothetical protein
MDTSGKACVDFWKWAPSKGLVNANTATALRVAVTQVLGVIDNWETVDVATLDTDDVFTRFVNLKSSGFTPDSLQTYKSRFNRALRTFLDYAKDPAAWKPKAAATAKKASNGSGAAGTPKDVSTDVVVTTQLPTSRIGLVEYPFPLREGRFAYLKLPADLTLADVKRLTAYLTTLALDDAAA